MLVRSLTAEIIVLPFLVQTEKRVLRKSVSGGVSGIVIFPGQDLRAHSFILPGVHMMDILEIAAVHPDDAFKLAFIAGRGKVHVRRQITGTEHNMLQSMDIVQRFLDDPVRRIIILRQEGQVDESRDVPVVDPEPGQGMAGHQITGLFINAPVHSVFQPVIVVITEKYFFVSSHLFIIRLEDQGIVASIVKSEQRSLQRDQDCGKGGSIPFFP